MKAMILAAGFGIRLRPLTETTPKPLIEINGKPIILYTLEALKKAGVRDIVINLHHLGYKIRQTLGNGSQFDVNIQYSDEPEIMGTAGALLLARKFLTEPFYLINADILFDLNLTILPSMLIEKNADAVMVLCKAKQDQKALANVYMDTHGYVRSLFKAYPGADAYIFTGIQFLKPNVIEHIPVDIKQPSTTMHMYPDMIRKGKLIAGYVHNGFWIDIGNPENLETAKRLFK
ncbi:MAG: nucleotidyltransferase family protein [bacterium]